MQNCGCDPLALTTAVNTLAVAIAVQRERCEGEAK